jgi:hypothetical protein
LEAFAFSVFGWWDSDIDEGGGGERERVNNNNNKKKKKRGEVFVCWIPSRRVFLVWKKQFRVHVRSRYSDPWRL